MRLLVCGGRGFRNAALLDATLDRVHAKYGDALLIIHGAAPGADLMAEAWAKAREVDYWGFPARWRTYGKAAGPKRNWRMRACAEPHACIAFAGGDGTRNMIGLMREIGIEPWLVGWPDNAETPAKQGDSA